MPLDDVREPISLHPSNPAVGCDDDDDDDEGMHAYMHASALSLRRWR